MPITVWIKSGWNSETGTQSWCPTSSHRPSLINITCHLPGYRLTGSWNCSSSHSDMRCGFSQVLSPIHVATPTNFVELGWKKTTPGVPESSLCCWLVCWFIFSYKLSQTVQVRIRSDCGLNLTSLKYSSDHSKVLDWLPACKNRYVSEPSLSVFILKRKKKDRSDKTRLFSAVCQNIRLRLLNPFYISSSLHALWPAFCCWVLLSPFIVVLSVVLFFLTHSRLYPFIVH